MIGRAFLQIVESVFLDDAAEVAVDLHQDLRGGGQGGG